MPEVFWWLDGNLDMEIVPSEGHWVRDTTFRGIPVAELGDAVNTYADMLALGPLIIGGRRYARIVFVRAESNYYTLGDGVAEKLDISEYGRMTQKMEEF